MHCLSRDFVGVAATNSPGTHVVSPVQSRSDTPGTAAFASYWAAVHCCRLSHTVSDVGVGALVACCSAAHVAHGMQLVSL